MWKELFNRTKNTACDLLTGATLVLCFFGVGTLLGFCSWKTLLFPIPTGIVLYSLFVTIEFLRFRAEKKRTENAKKFSETERRSILENAEIKSGAESRIKSWTTVKEQNLTYSCLHLAQAFLCYEDVAFWGSNWIEDPLVVNSALPGHRWQGIEFCLMCNDIFYPGADCEPVPNALVPDVLDTYLKYGEDGIIAWVGLRRGMSPDELFSIVGQIVADIAYHLQEKKQ